MLDLAVRLRARPRRVDGAHRLGLAAAAGAGDAGDPHAPVAPQSAGAPLGHGPRHRLGDRAVLGEQLGRHAHQLRLQLVAVGDRAAQEVVAAAGTAVIRCEKRPPVHDSAAVRVAPAARSRSPTTLSRVSSSRVV